MSTQQRFFRQLYPSYALAVLVVVAALGAYLSVRSKAEYQRRQIDDIETQLQVIKGMLAPWIGDFASSSIDTLCKRLGKIDDVHMLVVLPTGEIIGDSKRKFENLLGVKTRPEIAAALNGATGQSIRFDATLQTKMLFVAEPIYRDSVIVGALRLSIPVMPLSYFVSQTIGAVVLVGMFGLLLSALVCYVMARRLAKPLETLTEWAHNRKTADSTIVDVATAALMEQTPAGVADSYQQLNKVGSELDEKLADALRQKNEQSAIFQSMTEGIFAIDFQEKVVSANRVACEWFSITKKNIVGLTLQETARNSDLERIVLKALRSQTSEPTESELILPSGRILQVFVVALSDETDRSLGVVVALHDITQIRKLESVRKEFVANVSHELRTPITSIKGYIETLLLDGEPLTQTQRKFLGIISDQSERLDAIVNDLLTLSRIERESEIVFDRVDVKTIVVGAIGACQSRAEAKQIQIETKLLQGLSVSGSTLLLEQALINLLENAINYSEPETMIRVESSLQGADIHLRIIDQGIGIEKKHLPRLFERFYRTDKARNRKVGGSGLGLAIVKHIALTHKGEISVESVHGQGSVFILRLPQSMAE